MTQVVDITLREADAYECAKLGLSPRAALEDSIARSTAWWRVEIDDDTVCWWGYVDQVMSGQCVAWMLSTPGLELHRRAVARYSRELLEWLLETHSVVLVPVDPEYVVAVRWLEWLGFAPCGTNGPFTVMKIQRGGAA